MVQTPLQPRISQRPPSALEPCLVIGRAVTVLAMPLRHEALVVGHVGLFPNPAIAQSLKLHRIGHYDQWGLKHQMTI